MSDNPKHVLFFSNFQLTTDAINQVNALGLAVVYSKGKSRLIDEILTLKPAALVVDAKYCAERSIKCEFLLQKVQHCIRETPVFLVNASDVDYIKLMAENLIYALMRGAPDFSRISKSIRKYLDASKGGLAKTRVRNTVSLPCLVKKLGASGVVHGQICDLSPVGMKIVLDRASDDWAAGDEIRFSFAKANEKGAHFDGYGRVRWSEKIVGEFNAQRVRVGLEFSQLPLPTLHEFLDILNESRAA